MPCRCLQSESVEPTACNTEDDRPLSIVDEVSESRVDAVTESHTDTVAVDTELAVATAAKVRCLLDRRKVRLHSVIFINENENGEKRENNEFVNEN